MADLERSLRRLLRPGIEGFYSNDKFDPGGETICGIARNRWPRAAVWPIVDEARGKPDFPNNMKGDPRLAQAVKRFYRAQFWDFICGDQIGDQGVADRLFDCAVNQGRERAVGYLQRALNVLNRNGKVYPDLLRDNVTLPNGETQKALKIEVETGEAWLVEDLIESQQRMRSMELMESNPRFESTARGWFYRLRGER